MSGGRGYYLKREACLLNQALITYALQFAYQKGMTPVHTPFFMRKEIMAECAQLDDFDEQLYKVSGKLLRVDIMRKGFRGAFPNTNTKL